MTLKEFNPTGSTGEDDNDMLFRSYITGPQGARYDLLREKHHTNEDVTRAKKYLRDNFDVVKITIINETTS